MADRLVTVATFATALEAQLARNRLEVEGIVGYVADEVSVGMTWALLNSPGGVKLQVAEADVERASAALAEVGAGEADAGPWECPECGASVAADVEGCPACNQEVGCADPDLLAGEVGAPAEEIVSKADDLATRAFRAAVIGLVVCPPLVTAYSLVLLFRLALSSEEPSPAAAGKIYLALGVNLLALVWIAAFYLVFFAGLVGG